MAGAIFLAKPLLIAAAISLPFYIWLLHIKTSQSISLTAKISILSLTLVAIGTYPVYGIIAVVMVLATRAYYQNRFGMKYPSLN